MTWAISWRRSSLELNGRSYPLTLSRYMMKHPEKMEKLVGEMQKLKTSTGVDLDKYDYESLKATVKPQTIWVVQLERGPVLDPKTRQPLPLDDIPNTPGAVPTFTLYVYDEKGSFRATHDVEHLPQPADLLTYVLSVFRVSTYSHGAVMKCYTDGHRATSTSAQTRIAVGIPCIKEIPAPRRRGQTFPGLVVTANDLAL